MGLFWKLLAAGATVIGANVVLDRIGSHDSRTSTPCRFDSNISRQDFNDIVITSAQTISRIRNISITDALVFATVQSQSGFSEWSFTLDFNNYGRLTGDYWVVSDNDNSEIPQILGDKIRSAITNFGDCKEKIVEYNSEEAIGCTCPRCGEKQTVLGAKFCGFCSFEFPL